MPASSQIRRTPLSTPSRRVGRRRRRLHAVLTAAVPFPSPTRKRSVNVPPTSTPSLYAIPSPSSAGDRRERAGAVDLSGSCRPSCPSSHSATAISASRSMPVSIALAVEHVDEILGADVAGRARRERAAADAADRRVEHGRAASSAAYAFAKPVLRVLCRCTPTGVPSFARLGDELPDLARHADADRVREDDLVRAGAGDELPASSSTWPGSTAPSNGQPNATPIVTVARMPSACARATIARGRLRPTPRRGVLVLAVERLGRGEREVHLVEPGLARAGRSPLVQHEPA